MSFPKGNLDGIQRHYSIHNLSREIPREEIYDEEKKKNLQDTHHTPSHLINPLTESDELSQGNSQKKKLNIKDIELEEKNKEEKVDENTLMFEEKNISVPKLYCHLARQT